MSQKVVQIGSSAGVIIPKHSLEDLGLRVGDRVRVEVDKKRRAVLIEAAEPVDEELLAWTRGFIKKYRPALEALAKK